MPVFACLGICWKEPLRAPGLYIQAPARSLANSTQHSITKPAFLLAQYTVPRFCSSNERTAGPKKPAKSRSLFYLQWITYFTFFPLSLISNPSTLQVPSPRYLLDLGFLMSYFAIVTQLLFLSLVSFHYQKLLQVYLLRSLWLCLVHFQFL